MSFLIIPGDAHHIVRCMGSESVDCCVTSPPYWGLRDYGVEGQIGLEESPAEFVAKLVEVFREVRRVLKPDGTCWVNLGDSYAGSWGSQGRQGHGAVAGRSAVEARQGAAAARKVNRTGAIPEDSGLKPKDLVGIPWMVAFALRADGWYLRQDIIWHKPNPMPESVRDRCTKAHEYLFLLTKSARYFYDIDAVRERFTSDHPAGNKTHKAAEEYEKGDRRHRTKAGLVAYAQRSKDNRAVRSSEEFRGGEKRNRDMEKNGTTRGLTNQSCTHPNGKNRRSVWSIPSMPTPEAHFATFPIELPELCIRAGCPEGGLVLDPFSGAGTTGLACLKNGRRYVGVELNPEYVEMSRKRAERLFPLFAGAV